MSLFLINLKKLLKFILLLLVGLSGIFVGIVFVDRIYLLIFEIYNIFLVLGDYTAWRHYTEEEIKETLKIAQKKHNASVYEHSKFTFVEYYIKEALWLLKYFFFLSFSFINFFAFSSPFKNCLLRFI